MDPLFLILPYLIKSGAEVRKHASVFILQQFRWNFTVGNFWWFWWEFSLVFLSTVYQSGGSVWFDFPIYLFYLFYTSTLEGMVPYQKVWGFCKCYLNKVWLVYFVVLRGNSSLWIKSLWTKISQLAPDYWAARVPSPPCAMLQRKRVTKNQFKIHALSPEDVSCGPILNTLNILLNAVSCLQRWDSKSSIDTVKRRHWIGWRRRYLLLFKKAKSYKEKRSGNTASPCDKLWNISSRADLGGENCYSAEEEEHLCGGRSQIHDIRQSEDGIRPQRG